MMNILKIAAMTINFCLISPAFSQNNETSNQEIPSTKKYFSIEIKSENSQPVGLIGSNVRATFNIFEINKKTKSSNDNFIEFSENVLVNSYGRKGCIASSCLMEVTFDNGPTIKYKIHESKPNNYLRRVHIKDKDFTGRLLLAKNITIKIRFADAIDGIFIFKIPQNKINEK